MNLKDLRELLEVLEEREITEFELEEENLKLRIRKGGPPAPVAVPAPVLHVAAPVAAAPAHVAAVVAAAEDPTEAGLAVVKSPIVGTFYRAPDPTSAPFVSVGDKIRIGQVLCIIEAMKLMNEIEAEVAGEVVKVYKDSGQPVQYGEPLFSVRPDR